MRADQVLVFDADDTLWENNVVFERVIADFLDWLAHPALGRAELRAVLDEVQSANAVTHGYGSRMLVRSLRDCVGRLRGRPATASEIAEIDALAAVLISFQVEPVPGAAETLARLGERHTLLLLTKGDAEEQRRKIDSSGLARYFRALEIVPEKDEATYRRFVASHGIVPADGWMIGNSPKSDILPARRAGLNAVFIPNDNTWVLEHTELDPADTGVLHLRSLTELLDHF
ncbi:HAD family hydrolase [Kitasatospora sp. NBC_00240]|uniref:HAD family hydrolase n=1 Tax=Kitasatospora sp. NBC_00240 TaxID=2903567 RepID=UPI002259DC22|nr:HAD family hydrolase [Kitasatospora sp. NBC_00240]MCX5209551.1 HAD family hydrolase [Kitasatospora sp. NBC_00240]